MLRRRERSPMHPNFANSFSFPSLFSCPMSLNSLTSSSQGKALIATGPKAGYLLFNAVFKLGVDHHATALDTTNIRGQCFMTCYWFGSCQSSSVGTRASLLEHGVLINSYIIRVLDSSCLFYLLRLTHSASLLCSCCTSFTMHVPKHLLGTRHYI